MNARFRELLDYFVESKYNVIVMFNPHCKEAIQRIFVYNSYSIPNQGIFNYTVNGKDITKLIEALMTNNFIVPAQSDLGLTNQIDIIPNHTYEFSKDYDFELIRV